MDESIECKDCRGHGELLTQGNYYDFEPPTCKCLACDGTGVSEATMIACLKEQWQDKIPSGYWKDYVPTEAALKINKERIDKRLSGDKS